MLSLITIAAGITVPRMLAGIERARARGAARYVAAQLAMARTQAVSRAAAVALRFAQEGGETAISMVVDGNGNGVREREIEAGIDREIRAGVRLESLFPGVAMALPPGAEGDALRLAGTRLLTFTPAGTSSSGSIHLLGRDGSQFAIRVLGITGRVRLLRFDLATQQWVESL